LPRAAAEPRIRPPPRPPAVRSRRRSGTKGSTRFPTGSRAAEECSWCSPPGSVESGLQVSIALTTAAPRSRPLVDSPGEAEERRGVAVADLPAVVFADRCRLDPPGRVGGHLVRVVAGEHDVVGTH